ncbi:MAG TPA: IS3 family transposase [Planctomycetaceae bacterium]|nr:IS3 family transposase [Planctomycetaceae bacterium]
MDYVAQWSERTDIAVQRIVPWLGIRENKFYDWKQRYGRVDEHNGKVPRDWWLTEAEIAAILRFHDEHPLEGYRWLTFWMLDQDVVAVAPSTVHRVLSQHGLLKRQHWSPSKKGTGFVQPLTPHAHWHIDIAYLNIAGTFYYLCTVLDGYSRYIVHWEIREAMTEQDVEILLQRAREKFPDARPRIISDNGPQFIARDFKQFIRLCGMTHVRTSPYYPQSNGKLERYHRTIKHDCVRQKTPLTLDEARRVVTEFVQHYNDARLHSALGYVTPADKLAGREQTIFEDRDRKLAQARERRAATRQSLRQTA